MTRADLSKLRESMAEYLEKWVSAGHKLTSYRCRKCGIEETVRRPEPDMVQAKGYWDSTRQCTHCGDLNFVKVWPSGRTSAVEVGS